MEASPATPHSAGKFSFPFLLLLFLILFRFLLKQCVADDQECLLAINAIGKMSDRNIEASASKILRGDKLLEFNIKLSVVPARSNQIDVRRWINANLDWIGACIFCVSQKDVYHFF